LLCPPKNELWFYASVFKTVHKEINDKDYAIYAGHFATGIGGKVTGPNIGTLKAMLGDPDDPDQQPFLFTAQKAGKTTLTFTGSIKDSSLGPNVTVLGPGIKAVTEVPVKVSPCKFKVETHAEWHVPGPAHLFMAATSGEAEVKAPDAQSPFTGSSSVDWAVQAGSVGDCSGTVTMGSSQVDWTGQMDDNGQLTLNGTYQQSTGTEKINCGGSSQSRSFNLTPDPIKVSVDSSGGVTEQSEVVQGPEAVTGFVTIVVVPEEDEAAAFNFGNPEARLASPSPRWTMLSDNFPWHDNAFLALR